MSSLMQSVIILVNEFLFAVFFSITSCKERHGISDGHYWFEGCRSCKWSHCTVSIIAMAGLITIHKYYPKNQAPVRGTHQPMVLCTIQDLYPFEPWQSFKLKAFCDLVPYVLTTVEWYWSKTIKLYCVT